MSIFGCFFGHKDKLLVSATVPVQVNDNETLWQLEIHKCTRCEREVGTRQSVASDYIHKMNPNMIWGIIKKGRKNAKENS